eukprot:scaffold65212_cov31-Tisochrysis_lutea.AAC.3
MQRATSVWCAGSVGKAPEGEAAGSAFLAALAASPFPLAAGAESGLRAPQSSCTSSTLSGFSNAHSQFTQRPLASATAMTFPEQMRTAHAPRVSM